MFERRLIDLQKQLSAHNIDALLVSSSSNILYLIGVHFGPEERYAYLLVTKNDVYLFTDGRYIEGLRNLPKGVKSIHIDEIFPKIKDLKFKGIGFEQSLTFAEYEKFGNETNIPLSLTASLVEKLRVIKDTEEIRNVRAACKLTDAAYSHVLKNIRMETDMTEREIAWRIEQFIRGAGGEMAFESVVAFGENSAIPHHKTSDKKFSDKDNFVLLDFGAKVNNYCSDMTRTLIMKAAPEKARKIYETVLEAKEKAASALKQGEVIPSKLFEIANNHIISGGFPRIPHGLGHSLGIDVHENPRLNLLNSVELQKGTILTIEPGIYMHGFGGVRIEDDYLIGNELEQLTHSPNSLVEI